MINIWGREGREEGWKKELRVHARNVNIMHYKGTVPPPKKKKTEEDQERDAEGRNGSERG